MSLFHMVIDRNNGYDMTKAWTWPVIGFERVMVMAWHALPGS